MTTTAPTLLSQEMAEQLAATHLMAVPALHEHFLRQRVNWADQEAVHRAVMSLFPHFLPGPANAKRAAARILYRVETIHKRDRLLIQSAIPPATDLPGPPSATTTLGNLVGFLTPEAHVLLRLDFNAVTTQSRTHKRISIPTHEIPNYLVTPDHTGKLKDSVTNLTITDLDTTRRSTGRTPQHVAHITATAHIHNPNTLAHLIIDGVGRSKAYGCGLLSVIPTP